MVRILFVCHGNICRSPMAEFVMKDLVEKAGLIKPRKEGNGYYDVFRDRIMIPICDVLGRVIGFGGRTLGDDQPKYLNSPETEVFHKGKTLFALDKAKAAISQQDRVVVVEGYFDARGRFSKAH